MSLSGNGVIGRFARLAAVAAGGLALANCSGGLSGKLDPRYGVSASARVIEPGQPVPKGGGVYRVGKPYVVAGRVYVPEADPHYSAVGLASWYGDTSTAAIPPMARSSTRTPSPPRIRRCRCRPMCA